MLSLSVRGRKDTDSCSVRLPVITKPKSPASFDQLLPYAPETRGCQPSMLRLLSSYCKDNAASGSDKSSGRIVLKLTVPPTEPSRVFASGDLMTSTAEIMAGFTSSKLIPLLPDPELTVATPLNSTRFAFVPRI